jgi:glyoxylase-like metal-dependent hydrolase (beta-lactamase superfamily II)
MKKIAADLYLHTVPRDKWTNFSWLLQRRGSNYLIGCADCSGIIGELEKLGGVKKVFLTDIHFAQKWHGEVADHFKAQLVCHATDKDSVIKKCRTGNLLVVDERTQLDDDFEAIPTPGHADGGLCYSWTPGKRSYLFTGDFLCHTNNGWAVFCGQAKRKIMKQSLATVGELKVQALCPGVSEGDPVSMRLFKSGEYAKLIADTIEKYCG